MDKKVQFGAGEGGKPVAGRGEAAQGQPAEAKGATAGKEGKAARLSDVSSSLSSELSPAPRTDVKEQLAGLVRSNTFAARRHSGDGALMAELSSEIETLKKQNADLRALLLQISDPKTANQLTLDTRQYRDDDSSESDQESEDFSEHEAQQLNESKSSSRMSTQKLSL